ncbi:hypothetical protein [Allokutzneria oryzae]|uniref:Uncharacterized protein n=1 Tax=Allokutzneria oryzae TaxID=1378989 RepID=A0ABV5ZPR0_9PSEU
MSTSRHLDHAPVENYVIRGSHSGTGPGYTLEAAAVRICEDISELRHDGGISDEVHTTVTVLPQQGMLEIRVLGLESEADPDRVIGLNLLTDLFVLASMHNTASMDERIPPQFRMRILLIDADHTPYAALLGTAVGDLDIEHTDTNTARDNDIP